MQRSRAVTHFRKGNLALFHIFYFIQMEDIYASFNGLFLKVALEFLK